ncbi:MAG: hypothetical protein RMJ31_02305 [Nitrososphaerota archaeon]|nr:hypothetical protein [Nitrososphaerota archaeon]
MKFLATDDFWKVVKWYTFIPIVGYFLYLLYSSKDFPDVRGWKKLGIVLENSFLYLALGASARYIEIPITTWLIITTIVVIVITPIEFLMMKRWGHRFRYLGWHHIPTFTRRRFTLSMIYVAEHVWSFLNLGYIAMHLTIG